MLYKTRIYILLFFGLLGFQAKSQHEIHIGLSNPTNDYYDQGYAMKGLVLQYGGGITSGDFARIIANMALGYNAMDAKRFGQDYANAYWRNDPTGAGDSLISIKTGTYLYFTAHVGLELKIPIGDNYIPIRAMGGPHAFAPPNKHTIYQYGPDIDGNIGVKEVENLGTWSYDIMGMSYQLGTGIVMKPLSLRVEYFKSLGQLGDKDLNTAPWKYNSLFFSVGVIF